MGMYINPTNGQTKEDFVMSRGADIVDNPQWPAPVGKVILSWVHNGAFTALGICYSAKELEACKYIDKDPDDMRPHNFLLVDKAVVLSPESGLVDEDREILAKI